MFYPRLHAVAAPDPNERKTGENILASFCRESQNGPVESAFLAFFAASFSCRRGVSCDTHVI